jgi:CheY-like chemotaxis protein
LLGAHGHDVQTAFDGENAIMLARTFDPSVVLLDIGLPDMEGYEAARRLRASPETRNAKLIALTGYGQSSDLRAASEAGFDAHILKPAKWTTCWPRLPPSSPPNALRPPVP